MEIAGFVVLDLIIGEDSGAICIADEEIQCCVHGQVFWLIIEAVMQSCQGADYVNIRDARFFGAFAQESAFRGFSAFYASARKPELAIAFVFTDKDLAVVYEKGVNRRSRLELTLGELDSISVVIFAFYGAHQKNDALDESALSNYEEILRQVN